MRKAGKGQLPTLQKEDEGHYPQRVVNAVNCQWYDNLRRRKKIGTPTLSRRFHDYVSGLGRWRSSMGNYEQRVMTA